MPLLFSYGTLREAQVQLSTFGRRLAGTPDALPGFEPSLFTDQHGQHANVKFSGNDGNRVAGLALEITDAELAMADAYEAPFCYKRIAVKLASGTEAWVYVHVSDQDAQQ